MAVLHTKTKGISSKAPLQFKIVLSTPCGVSFDFPTASDFTINGALFSLPTSLHLIMIYSSLDQHNLAITSYFLPSLIFGSLIQ